MSEQVEKISRENLYQKVWAKPFVKLAAELGYSYPELIQICADLNIPRPTGGYWYRLAHGGVNEQTALQPTPPGRPNEIEIKPKRLNAKPPTVEQVDDKSSKEKEVETTKSETAKAAVIEVHKLEEHPAEAPVCDAETKSEKTTTAVVEEKPKWIDYTREQLYAAIWSTPCSKLAATLGISDVALAKTCRRLGIPRPPRGYWARVEAGEKLRREPLPPATASQNPSVTFYVADNLVRREEWAANNILTAGRGGRKCFMELPPEGCELHPIAKRHQAAFEKAKPGALGFVKIKGRNLFSCKVSATILPRLLRTLHAVVCELEVHFLFPRNPGALISMHRFSESFVSFNFQIQLGFRLSSFVGSRSTSIIASLHRSSARSLSRVICSPSQSFLPDSKLKSQSGRVFCRACLGSLCEAFVAMMILSFAFVAVYSVVGVAAQFNISLVYPRSV